jgi:pilus assembly protein Flp/PilA
MSQLKTEPNEVRNLAKGVAGWLSLDSERGVTAIEYALVAALIAISIIAGATLIGTHLSGIFSYIAPKLTAP